MNLTLSVSPHLCSPRSTRRIMLDVVLALLPALIASVWYFGWRSLLLTAVSAAACVFFEFLWEKLSHAPLTVGDLSAVVTGILLAYNVPVGMPVWELIVGDAAAILVVKMLFGGLGCNFVNPALVGRIVLMFSFPTDMTTYIFPRGSADAFSSATPLAMLDKLTPRDFPQLLLGCHGGVIGETCMLALLVGGAYLLVRKVITPAIPLSFLGAVLLFTWLFGGSSPILAVFSGGVMLGAIFMATDYVTSPFTLRGKLIFGAGCGFITAFIRAFGHYTEGVTFAILLMNLVVPYINDLTMTRPVGGVTEK
jgi:electron transport complex protein RnfD